MDLDENAVVAAMCEHLRNQGYVIDSYCKTTEKGIDIVAHHPDTRSNVFVEAKGETSSREGSERAGKGFSSNQIFNRVSKGVFTCLQLRSRDENAKVILALPDNPRFREYVATVSRQLESVRVDVWYAPTTEQCSDDEL